MLERELKSELDFPRSCVAVKATKTARSAMTKVRVVDIVDESQIRSLEPGEVHTIEEIEHLCAELNAITFTNSPILIHREVDILAGRHSYYAAPECAELTFSRQTEGCRVQVVNPVIEIDGNARHEIRSLSRLRFETSRVCS